jgi:hypothetical protein
MPNSKNINLNSNLTFIGLHHMSPYLRYVMEFVESSNWKACILRVFSIYLDDLKLCSIVLEVRFNPSGLDRGEYNNQAQLSGSSP